MAFTETPLTPARDSPVDWSGGEPDTPQRDRSWNQTMHPYDFFGAAGFDTGERGQPSGWVKLPLTSAR